MSQLWLAGLLVLALVFGVGGCSIFEAPKPDASPQAPPPDTKSHAHAQQIPKQKPKPPPPIPDLREADTHEPEPPPPPKVASIDPNSLIGLDPPSVQKLLGAPANIRTGNPSIIWTYAGTGCVFQVIFYPDIKTANFHALKFLASDGAGGHADETCIHNLLVLRNNGPA